MLFTTDDRWPKFWPQNFLLNFQKEIELFRPMVNCGEKHPGVVQNFVLEKHPMQGS